MRLAQKLVRGAARDRAELCEHRGKLDHPVVSSEDTQMMDSEVTKGDGEPRSFGDRAALDAEASATKLAEATEPVARRARQLAEQQKAAGAETIGGLAGAVHGAARELESQIPQAASYVHDAAARLEDAALQLRQRSLDELASSLGKFARTQPAAFFGGAVLAGFAISRFLKSSGPTGSNRHV